MAKVKAKSKAKSSLTINDFIDIKEVNQRIKEWIIIRENTKKVLIYGVGAIAGVLIGGGDLLFGGLITGVSLYFAVTQSGDSIINYLLDAIKGIFKTNPIEELAEAKEKLRVKLVEGK